MCGKYSSFLKWFRVAPTILERKTIDNDLFSAKEGCERLMERVRPMLVLAVRVVL